MGLPSIEVLDINDKKPVQEEPIVPHERQIVEGVIRLWKQDPDSEDLGISKLHQLIKQRNPSWSLSEKRLKASLKAHNLLISSQQYTYAGEITSKETPNLELPKNIRLQFTKNRGKGLYASRPFKEGDLIWEEKYPLFFVPVLETANLIKTSNACTYCGTLLKTNSKSVLRGLDCNVCSDVWCSINCKKLDTLHQALKHNLFSDEKSKKPKPINSSAWAKYLKFCYDNKWQAAYAIGMIHAYCITDKTGILTKQFDAFAKVGQDIRYKALDSSGIGGSFDSNNNGGGALFVKEQQEQLWKQGYELFSNVFPLNKLEYKEYLEYLGTYNINNVNCSMFSIQSHLNHNCEPNVRVLFGDKKADGISVLAKRDIKANEELVTSYVNPSHELYQRQRELRVNWGFICNCNKCKEDAKKLQRRKSSSTSGPKSKKDIKEMLSNGNQEEFELEIPDQQEKERRKSVRFDEKVIAVKEEK